MPISYAGNIKRLLAKLSLGRKMASPGFFFSFKFLPTTWIVQASHKLRVITWDSQKPL